MRLSGKVALITGGASGMGRSEATIFAREGARGVVGDVLEADGHEVAEKMAAAGGQDRSHMGYDASKGAVRLMTTSAAVQYAKDRIRVNSVHPGVMPPMRTAKASADPAWREKTLRAVPMKREGRVEEVAYAVLFLA